MAMKLGGETRQREPAQRKRQPKMIEGHDTHRDRLLRHAAEMLDKRDRLQASEKIWGAVAHAVKQVARRRKWPCYSHEDLRDVARYLSDKEQRPDLFTLFGAVEGYHRNFYADTFELPDLRAGLRDAAALVGLLTRIDETLPLTLAPPHGRDYQAYEKRHRVAA